MRRTINITLSDKCPVDEGLKRRHVFDIIKFQKVFILFVLKHEMPQGLQELQVLQDFILYCPLCEELSHHIIYFDSFILSLKNQQFLFRFLKLILLCLHHKPNCFNLSFLILELYLLLLKPFAFIKFKIIHVSFAFSNAI